ncbi:MAG: DnaA regulatory inactivator Hda [Pseudomonadales bacterium]
MQQLALAMRLNDELTFANYFPGQANALAFQTLSEIVNSAAELAVFIAGPQSSGKSHLLQAVCHAASIAGRTALYLPLGEMSDYDPAAVLDGLEHTNIVCLDEIDSVLANDEWELQLFNLYNRMLSSGNRLLVASRQAPSGLAVQLPDLLSRLNQMLVLTLKSPSDDDCIKALQMRASVRGMNLNDELAQYILSRQRRDMRSLMVCLELLDQTTLDLKRKLTIPLIREVLAQNDA